MAKITPNAGAMQALSCSQRNKVKKVIEDVKWFLKGGEDLTAYRLIWPVNCGKKKNMETILAIWSKLDSKERAKLKEVGRRVNNGL